MLELKEKLGGLDACSGAGGDRIVARVAREALVELG